MTLKISEEQQQRHDELRAIDPGHDQISCGEGWDG
jgi:hypothetical protein